MNKILDKLHQLALNRLNMRLKHLRGRHDQLDHAWNRGMGRGGGGVGLAPNQQGPVVSQDFYRKRKVELMDQKRQGLINNTEMRRQLDEMQGKIPENNVVQPTTASASQSMQNVNTSPVTQQPTATSETPVVTEIPTRPIAQSTEVQDVSTLPKKTMDTLYGLSVEIALKLLNQIQNNSSANYFDLEYNPLDDVRGPIYNPTNQEIIDDLIRVRDEMLPQLSQENIDFYTPIINNFIDENNQVRPEVFTTDASQLYMRHVREAADRERAAVRNAYNQSLSVADVVVQPTSSELANQSTIESVTQPVNAKPVSTIDASLQPTINVIADSVFSRISSYFSNLFNRFSQTNTQSNEEPISQSTMTIDEIINQLSDESTYSTEAMAEIKRGEQLVLDMILDTNKSYKQKFPNLDIQEVINSLRIQNLDPQTQATIIQGLFSIYGNIQRFSYYNDGNYGNMIVNSGTSRPDYLGISSERLIRFDHNIKQINIDNVSFKNKGQNKVNGLGYAMLRRQAYAAMLLQKENNYDVRAETFAQSSSDMNGLHTWPKLGYSFLLNEFGDSSVAYDVVKQFGFTSTNTADLMQEQNADGQYGYTVWPYIVNEILSVTNAYGIKGYMIYGDLQNLGFQTMLQYGERKQTSQKSTGDEVQFDDFDMTIIDEIWSELVRNRKTKKKSLLDRINALRGN